MYRKWFASLRKIVVFVPCALFEIEKVKCPPEGKAVAPLSKVRDERACGVRQGLAKQIAREYTEKYSREER